MAGEVSDIQSRLIGCFRTVFPDLPETRVTLATQQSVPNWDSIATVTLINVIDDEFQIEMDLEQLTELDSFENFYTYLKNAIKA
jgi:acyl carrier protein